jgi:hypothetical protein
MKAYPPQLDLGGNCLKIQLLHLSLPEVSCSWLGGLPTLQLRKLSAMGVVAPLYRASWGIGDAKATCQTHQGGFVTPNDIFLQNVVDFLYNHNDIRPAAGRRADVNAHVWRCLFSVNQVCKGLSWALPMRAR